MLTTLLVLTASLTAHAGVTTVSTRVESQGSAKFIEYKKEVVLPGAKPNEISYLTDTRMIVDAKSPDKIEDTAVVQWIRGCVFSSDATGRKTLDVSRQHFGRIKTFKHPTWEIDSDSTDPIYSSYAPHGRFALLRWNQNPKSSDAETATYYAAKRPPHGVTFVTDLPASAFASKFNDAQNVSLEFRTCLFKTSDLPATTSPDGANLPEQSAIWCVSWDHKFVYDFKSQTMTKPSQIDAICLNSSP